MPHASEPRFDPSSATSRHTRRPGQREQEPQVPPVDRVDHRALDHHAHERESADGRPNRIMFRGGPYGGDQDYVKDRMEKNGPFPERGPDEGLLMGARNGRPINGGGDWIVTNPDHWIFAGTGMKKGDRIPGLVGWEYHNLAATEIPGLEIIAEGPVWVGGETLSHYTATVYPGPKGNWIFNAATIFWCQGLSHPPGHTLPWSHWSRPHGPDERVQQITRNFLNKVLAR